MSKRILQPNVISPTERKDLMHPAIVDQPKGLQKLLRINAPFTKRRNHKTLTQIVSTRDAEVQRLRGLLEIREGELRTLESVLQNVSSLGRPDNTQLH